MLKARRGTIFYDPRRRKKYTRNKDVYVICIRASNNMRFYRYVGFAITRKQARLENYVKRNTGAPTLPQPFPNPSSK
jgi:intein-encoded DNA endonuclease-like protein